MFFARNVVDSDGNLNNGGNQFYTFRMEHREGGLMAKFRGEERILLFRSDRAGAVAKIIYSSEVPDDEVNYNLGGSVPILQQEGTQHLQPQHLTVHAKIHVLDVKSQYRGRDLGGLLFSEAVTSLKSHYCYDDDESDDVGPVKSEEMKKKRVYDVECSLDAEEDITRHGKLVKFYE